LELLDQVLGYLVARKDRGELNPGQLEMLHYLLGKRGDAYFDRGDYDNALKTFRRSLDLASDARRRVIMSALIGRTSSFRGDHDAAREYFERADKLARELPDDYLLSFVLEQEAHAAGHNEDYETARQVAAEQVAVNERLLETHQDVDIHKRLATSLLNLGTAELRLATHNALLLFLRAEKIAEDLDDDLYRAWSRFALGETYNILGQRDQASMNLNGARVLLHRRGAVREERDVVEYMRAHGHKVISGEDETDE
jgi:tetratricopeptide (TPR) repeat protein